MDASVTLKEIRSAAGQTLRPGYMQEIVATLEGVRYPASMKNGSQA